MSLQTATIKGLAHTLPKDQVLFLYKLTVFIISAFAVIIKGTHILRTRQLPLLFIRAVLSTVAAWLFVESLKSLKISNAFAIGFTEPLFASVLAIVFLKEGFSRYNIIALATGFVGAMIVIRPNAAEFNTASLYALAASIVWSLDNVVIKLLGRTEGSTQYLFYISLFSSLMLSPFAWRVWQPINTWQLPWLCALAALYLLHVLAVFKAFQYAKISNLAPCDFSRLVFGTIVGYIAFKEYPDAWVVIGSVLIISSSAYIIWSREKITIREKIRAKIQAYRSQKNAI
jgi:S-adenosylmethionine uptake transporter